MYFHTSHTLMRVLTIRDWWIAFMWNLRDCIYVVFNSRELLLLVSLSEPVHRLRVDSCRNIYNKI